MYDADDGPDPTLDPSSADRDEAAGAGDAPDAEAAADSDADEPRSQSSRLRAAGDAAMGGARALVQRVIDIAPRIPVRELDVLQRHHGGLDGEALADSLVDTASRA